MIEKFSDYEGGFINVEGDFEFEITEAEIKESKKGDPMVVLTAKSPMGQTTLRHSLIPKARWSYNNLIKACLHLNTPQKIASFELDYETIHRKLIGTKFIGHVEKETYIKEVKTPLDDGTFMTEEVPSVSYKVTSYSEVQ